MVSMFSMYVVGLDNVDVIFFDGHSQGKLDDIWIKLFGQHVFYIKQAGVSMLGFIFVI